MPRICWPLLQERPRIQLVLTLAGGGPQVTRNLLADSGAGSLKAIFAIVLDEHDCVLCDGYPFSSVVLRGAYAGSYPTYLIRVQIPQLGFDQEVTAVGIPTPPSGFDGIACFPFLNRFTYGNFGDPAQFGVEV
jgi:hypothetical protein